MNPSVTDVASYGTTNWNDVQARSSNLVDEIHGLGKVMSNGLAYKITFPKIDPIVIGDRWNIVNGRHRTLTLRTLGPEFVSKQGMNRWVDIQRNDGSF